MYPFLKDPPPYWMFTLYPVSPQNKPSCHDLLWYTGKSESSLYYFYSTKNLK